MARFLQPGFCHFRTERPTDGAHASPHRASAHYVEHYSFHSTGAAVRWSFFECFAIAAAGLPCSGSAASPNPLTMPNTAGMTVRVCRVDAIMPPILRPAVRLMISQPVPEVHMNG